jgi:hypothetical protein
MTELEEFWAGRLAEATLAAENAGRGSVAEYLALKASNDALRAAAAEWIFATLIELAHADDAPRSTVVEREEPHSFRHAGANQVGSLLRLRYGVRSLTVEAGWTRTPADGFMRDGALAVARIAHFGIPSARTELTLTRMDAGPAWVVSDADNPRVFELSHLRAHFDLLIERKTHD